MWAKVKRIGVFLVGLGGFIVALLLMRGRAGKAGETAQKADEKRKQADAIDNRIGALKKESAAVDENIRAERERIDKIDDLGELKDEFTKQGY